MEESFEESIQQETNQKESNANLEEIFKCFICFGKVQ